MNEEELKRLYDRYVQAKEAKSFADLAQRTAAGGMGILPRAPRRAPTALDRALGATTMALGPLARRAIGAYGAAAGSPGAEERMIQREDEFGRDFPVTAVGLGLTGAVPRYVAASVVPGGPAALGVAESLASRPQESLPGLAATVAGMTGRPELQGRLQNVAENPLARAAADALGGELIGGVFRAVPAVRRGIVRRGEEARGAAELAAIRDRGATQYGAEAGPAGFREGPSQNFAIPMRAAGQRVTDPTRMLPAGDVPIDLSSEPSRLLAAVAQSLEGSRTSPFVPGQVAGPALPGVPIPGGRRDFVAPIGPEVVQNPDIAAQQNRLLEMLTSQPSEVAFRNPETNRMAMMGGAAASRRDVPLVRGSDPVDLSLTREELLEQARQALAQPDPEAGMRRMLVPKQNIPGEVVGDVQARESRLLGDMLEGRTNLEGLTPGMESPAFRANTPIRLPGDVAPAPLTPPLRQTPETRQMFPVGTGPENLMPELRPQSPIRTALEAAGPAPTVTRLDPGGFPFLVNRRAGGRAAVPRRVTGGGPVEDMLTGSSPTGPFADTPRSGISLGYEGDIARPVRPQGPSSPLLPGSARNAPSGGAMVEGAEDVRSPSMQEMEFMEDMRTPSEQEYNFASDAPDSFLMGDIAENLRNREGFTTVQILEALARAGVGGAGGGIVGGAMGQTPEERRAFALAGLGFGMGLGGASGFIGRQSAQNRRINDALNDVERVMRRRPEASPTATPFSSTGAPPGIERATITGAPGVAAASPTPQPRTAGEPIVRPTTVKPKDEPRLQRLNLTPEMQDIYGPRIRALSAEIASSGKQTWQDLKEEAARLLNVKREMLADINPNRMTGAEGLAIASLVRENTESLARLAKDYDTAVSTGVTADVERIAGLMNDLEDQTAELLQVFMKGTSAQGRALQAQRVLANLNTDPTYWFAKGQRIKGSDVLTADERKNIVRLLNGGEAKRDELTSYLASLRRTGVLGQVAQIRRGSLLSGLTGRIYDFVGTGLNMLETGARPLAAAIDRAASARVAKKVGSTTAEQRSLLVMNTDEAVRTGKGALRGIGRAVESLGIGAFAPSNIRAKGLRASVKEWSDYIRQIELDPQAAARLDVPRMVNITMFGESRPGQALNTIADTYQKFFMRFSGVTDKIFRAGAYSGAMQEQARLVATREGLTGKRFQARVRKLLREPTDAMRANAIYESELATFTNEGSVANAVGAMLEAGAQGLQKARKPGLAAQMGEVARGLGNIIIPFRRTPSNILTRVLEFTPVTGEIMTAKRVQNWWGDVALLAAAGKAERAGAQAAVTASQRKMVQSLTRNATGAGMVGLGFWLYDNDLLTGDQPADQTEAEQWRTEGRLPNSIYLPINGGEWVPISRLAPLGTVLAVAANFKQSAGDASTSAAEKFMGFTGNALRTVLDQPMLTGPKEAIDALTGRDDWKRESFMQNMAGSFVPTALASGARASGEQRMPGGMGEAIAMRIPGMEQSVAVRRDIFGAPTQRATGYFLPTAQDLRRTDPLVAEMARVGAQVGSMDKGKGEDPSLYEWRTEQAGRRVRAAMERVVSTPRYQNATPKDQKELLENAASGARTKFSKEIKRTYNIESP